MGECGDSKIRMKEEYKLVMFLFLEKCSVC